MAIRIIVNGTGKQIRVTATSPQTTVVDQQQGGGSSANTATTNTGGTGVTR